MNEEIRRGDFIGELHEHGSSNLFLVGIIMFSVGGLLSNLVSLSLYSIFGLGIFALPVIGFWMIYATCKEPEKYGKINTALSLFRASAIISLVWACLGVFLMFLGGLIAFVFGAAFVSYGGTAFIAVSLVIFIVAGGLLTIAIMYFKAILRVLNGIKDNMLHDTFNMLEGVTVVTVLTCIFSALSIIFLLILAALDGFFVSLANGTLPDEIMREIPPEVVNAFAEQYGTGAGSGFLVSTLFTLVSLTGGIICLVVLNKFNNEIKNTY